MTFEVLHRDGRARVGKLRTRRGDVETPCFMPVGTKGAVKTILPADLKAMGFQMILSNTYHLRCRPGDDIVRKLGGLHRFMGWDGPILTDSGGYQIFSLPRLRSVRREGVEFQSHVDGTRIFLGPEEAMDIQGRLGADVVMPLDCPVEYPAPPEQVRKGLDLTLGWLERSVRRWRRWEEPRPLLFGIVQGGWSKALRQESIERSMAFDLPGFAIGGLSLKEPKELLMETMDFTIRALPEERPRYVMGIGTPGDILRAVWMGADLFDCILPTRLGRTGWAFTRHGILKLRNSRFRDDDAPLDDSCDGVCCRDFTRGYLRHCFNVGEILGQMLVSHHNLRFYSRWMRDIRRAIRAGRISDMVRDAAKA